jgi:hypothetical protein
MPDKPAFDPNPPDLNREDWKDLLELRAAVGRNAGKPGAPWEQVKKELEIDS